MPEKNPDEVVLKIRVRREVVAAFAPAAAYARTTTPQLMRELIPYMVGMLDGPPAQWPEVLERIRQENLAKGAGKAPASALFDADGKPVPAVLLKMTPEQFLAMDPADVKKLGGFMSPFRGQLSFEQNEAFNQAYEAMLEMNDD